MGERVFPVVVMATDKQANMFAFARLQAALWTRIFKHHLDLGHNSEAYEALTQNPDSSMYVQPHMRAHIRGSGYLGDLATVKN